MHFSETQNVFGNRIAAEDCAVNLIAVDCLKQTTNQTYVFDLIWIDCREFVLHISESDVRLLRNVPKHFQGAFSLASIVRGPSNREPPFKNVKLLT